MGGLLSGGGQGGLKSRPPSQRGDSVAPGAHWDGRREDRCLSAAGRRPGRGSAGAPAAVKSTQPRSRGPSGPNMRSVRRFLPTGGGKVPCRPVQGGPSRGAGLPPARRWEDAGRSRRTPIGARERERSRGARARAGGRATRHPVPVNRRTHGAHQRAGAQGGRARACSPVRRDGERSGSGGRRSRFPLFARPLPGRGARTRPPKPHGDVAEVSGLTPRVSSPHQITISARFAEVPDRRGIASGVGGVRPPSHSPLQTPLLSSDINTPREAPAWPTAPTARCALFDLPTMHPLPLLLLCLAAPALAAHPHPPSLSTSDSSASSSAPACTDSRPECTTWGTDGECTHNP